MSHSKETIFTIFFMGKDSYFACSSNRDNAIENDTEINTNIMTKTNTVTAIDTTTDINSKF